MIGPAQRWSGGRTRFRPPGETIDPSRYGVELLVGDTTPRAFVERHHYSGSWPAARCRVGLYRMRELVGVAVFAVPAQAATVPRWTRLPADRGVVLSRFVLLEDVPCLGETWFLARAFRVLRSELGVDAVVSYSDPVERRTVDGDLVKPGHVGVIYQAHNGRYLGRSKSETLHLDPLGRVVDRRGLSKVRNDERGAASAYDRLVAAGAPRRRLGEDGPAYVTRALAEGPFRRVRHPGNHVYAWPLRRGVHLGAGLPYPRMEAA